MNSSSCAHHPFLLCSIILNMLSWSSMLIMTAVSLSTTSPVNHTDQLALLAFKSQITHDPLRLLDSWNNTHHFCQWQGVACGRRHQRVVALHLRSHGLVGSLSPYIGNLSFLHYVDLENNSFYGEIPSEVGSLYRLRVFGMTNNSLTGEIPSNFSQCSNLKTIVLRNNKLSGKIPKELGLLQKLMELVLMNNNITGDIPYALGNLSSLQVFDLSFNNLVGRIPDSLGQLKNLQDLELGSNMLSSTVPPSIYNLSSLQFLAFPFNQIFDKLPSDIGLTLPNLQQLICNSNYFFGSLPFSLLNFSTLDMLELAVNGFIGQVPVNMGGMPNLQVLSLYENHLGSSGKVDDLKFLSTLTNSSNLQFLDAANNQLSGTLHISLLANVSSTKLERLYLGKNQISGIIPSKIIELSHLTLLSLRNNFLTGSIPQGIGKLNNLQQLALEENKLSGQIPSSINNLTNLLYLGLSGNNFEGRNIPSTSNLHSLQGLYLSRNKLNATLEQVFGQLSHELLYAYLDDNSFTGSLPVEVGDFEYLIEMDISKNKLAGEIPSTLGKCLSLQQLSLKGNSFHGSIPPSFSSLRGLQILDLSLNNLSGDIPMFLQNLSSSLEYLDLSFNNFEGAVPTEGLFQNASAFSILGNRKLCGGIPKLQLPVCPAHKQKHYKKHQMPLHLKVAIGVIVSATVLAALLLAVLCWMRRPKNETHQTQKNLHDHYERVSFLDLHRATDGFSPANSIGTGHFGSVFKGIIREGTEPVAVKVLNMIEHKASKSFMAECEALRNVRHRNLMKVITACSTVDFQGNDFKALIFKFMPNGSLENWLHPVRSDGRYPTESLNFSRRLNLAIDIASAMDYLHNHCETPIIHCDLKPSNILLDEDMVAHVGDFGLAKFLQRQNSDSSSTNNTSSFSPRGTIGYIPPEYGIGVKPSTQGDMYSYGVLLLEMFTGKRPTDQEFKDGLDLHQFCKISLHKEVMKIIDPHMLEHEEEANNDHRGIHVDSSGRQRGTRRESGKVEECITSIMKVGVGCSTPTASERMEIKDALKELLAAKKFYES
ncbi:hypothetical protein Sjap_001889 [Stephania japonica]|uniref:non-specific serine/threonine protein kinase n=1 Tax=Stephania japonica TaxID=461633 RepID=A0AAP0KN46_9MAGN